MKLKNVLILNLVIFGLGGISKVSALPIDALFEELQSTHYTNHPINFHIHTAGQSLQNMINDNDNDNYDNEIKSQTESILNEIDTILTNYRSYPFNLTINPDALMRARDIFSTILATY